MKKLTNSMSGQYLTVFRLVTILMALLIYLSTYEAIQLSHVILIVIVLAANVTVTLLLRMGLTEKQVMGLILVEVVGYTCIVFPSGGLESPFFMTVLNPLVSGMFYACHPRLFNWFSAYFASLLLTCGLLSGHVATWFQEHIELLFSYGVILGVLMILFDHMLSITAVQKEISQTNEQLHSSLKVQEKLNGNMRQYIGLAEKLSIAGDMKQLVQEIVHYLDGLTEEGIGFYLLDGEADCLWTSNPIYRDSVSALAIDVRFELYETEQLENLICGDLAHMYFINCRSEDQLVTIGLVLPTEQLQECQDIMDQQFRYITKLYRIVESKIRLGQLRETMIVKEEQNRIAEAMHDQVNQQLFAISCLAYQTVGAMEDQAHENALAMLRSLYERLKNVNLEIRNIVYSLSTRKQESPFLKHLVEAYLSELKALYGIHIEWEVDETLIDETLAVKQTLMRLLNEAISNAVRHGAADCVTVTLENLGDYMRLSIRDNGKGMDLNTLNQADRGLGLGNMMRLAALFNGNLEISSGCGEGTELVFHLVIRHKGGGLLA